MKASKIRENKNSLRSIKVELKACRAAWRANPRATSAWCYHPMILWEPLTEPPTARIVYIMESKISSERASRLRNFRPVRIQLPASIRRRMDHGDVFNPDLISTSMRKTLEELHDQDWSDHTWNGHFITGDR